MDNNIQPVLIGGCGRSGTTMLASLLGIGDNTIATPESDFIYRYYKEFVSSEFERNSNFSIFLENDWRFKQWKIGVPTESNDFQVENITDIRKAVYLVVKKYASQIYKIDKILYWIDHTPQNIRLSHTMLNIFPNAKFVNVVRDPRAIHASVKKLDWGPNSAYKTAKWWSDNLASGFVLEHTYPDRVITVKYEDLVNDTKNNLQHICQFIGKEYNEEMINGTGFRPPSYSKKQHKLVGKSIDSSRIMAWEEELSDYEVSIIEATVNNMLQLLGYNVRSKKVKGVSFSDKFFSAFIELIYKVPNIVLKKIREL